jgi:hypothetical protein
VIQYLEIDFMTLGLVLVHQQVLKQLPDHFHYRYARETAPDIVLLKIYFGASDKYSKIFLLSLTKNVKKINSSSILTDENLCFNVKNTFKTISGKF